MEFPDQIDGLSSPYRKGKGQVVCRNIPQKIPDKGGVFLPDPYLTTLFQMNHPGNNEIVQCVSLETEDAMVEDELKKADIAIKNGDVSKSVTILTGITKKHPDSKSTTKAWLILGFIYSGIGLVPAYKNSQMADVLPLPRETEITKESDKAKVLLKKVVDLSPDSRCAAYAKFCLAVLSIKEGNPGEAAALLGNSFKTLKELTRKPSENNRANHYLEYKFCLQFARLLYSADKKKFSDLILKHSKMAIKVVREKFYLTLEEGPSWNSDSIAADLHLYIMELSWNQKEVADSYAYLSIYWPKTCKEQFASISSRRNGLSVARLKPNGKALFFFDNTQKDPLIGRSTHLLLKLDSQRYKAIRYYRGVHCPIVEIIDKNTPRIVLKIIDPKRHGQDINAFSEAMRILPPEILKNLTAIYFTPESDTEYDYRKGIIFINYGGEEAVIHELSHHDDLGISRGRNGKDIWRFRGKNYAPGDDSQLFYEIDWPDEKIKFELDFCRSDNTEQTKIFNPESFASSYAMCDRREDRAEFQEKDYMADKKAIRERIRRKLSTIRSSWNDFSSKDEQSKYYPHYKRLLKYLHIRYLSSSKGKEYGLSAKSPSLGMAEAEKLFSIEKAWLIQQQGLALTKGEDAQLKIEKSLKEIKRLEGILLKIKQKAIQKGISL